MTQPEDNGTIPLRLTSVTEKEGAVVLAKKMRYRMRSVRRHSGRDIRVKKNPLP